MLMQTGLNKIWLRLSEQCRQVFKELLGLQGYCSFDRHLVQQGLLATPRRLHCLFAYPPRTTLAGTSNSLHIGVILGVS